MQTIMERARELANKIGELPAIPSVVLNAMSLLNDPSVTVKKIQEQILMDQGLTAYILKIANSPLYGLRKEVSTVSYAINLMGYNTTKSILMAYLTKNIYNQSGSKFIHNLLWKHSLCTAVIAKELAGNLNNINVEEVFITALLHDIGKAVMLKNRSEEFQGIVEKVLNEGGSMIEEERKAFGFTHVEVGYLVMKNWRFSEGMVETLVYHHNLQDYYGNNRMVPIVSLANKLSSRVGYSLGTIEGDLYETEILSINEEQLENIVNNAMADIEQFLELFG